MSNFEGGSPTTKVFDDKNDAQIDRPSDCKTEVNEGTTSDDQVNTEQLSSSSPRSASDVRDETLQSESRNSATNGFAPTSYSYSLSNENDRRFEELERLEAFLADGYYGNHRPTTDTDGILQETKDRIPSDTRYQRPSNELHELYHRRSQLGRPKQPRPENGRGSAESILYKARKWNDLNHPDVSRIWALIIGINKYCDKELKPLKGCINDGRLMKEYLTKDLCVPQDHVRCLFDEKATRAAILSALSDLRTNTSINRGDIIIIYFAGHGSNYLCSEHRKKEFGEKEKPLKSGDLPRCFCPVEAICPVDRGCDNNQFPSGKVPDISDREINANLSRISQHKGHRITVILDCCHSGSATREVSDTVARTIPPLPPAVYDDMRNSGLGSLFSNQFPSVSEDKWRPDMSCHVVIAACQGHQTTGERESAEQKGLFYGNFTRVLVETLRYWLKEGVQLTYVLLLDALPVHPIQWQTPIVAGSAIEKLLWSHQETTSPLLSPQDML